MTRREARPDRVQTGVRLERRLVKVLKALAELQDLSLGDLLEAMTLRCLAGQVALDEGCVAKARDLMGIYGLEAATARYDAAEGGS
jgi:hypothetical protein